MREVSLIIDALQNAGAELRARMERQRLLSRELSHRVKNVLGVVQALVQRTLTKRRPLNQASDLIVQRLQALSRSQDLLTRSDWTDLPLRQIVEMEIAPFSDRIACEGPDILVKSDLIQDFGLLVHELTTNAVKYGALRDRAGTIVVTWSADEFRGARRFRFQWKECCRPVAGAAAEAGFGTTLLKSVLRSPDTTSRLEVEPDGFRFTLDAALHLVTRETEAEAIGLPRRSCSHQQIIGDSSG